MLKEMIKEYKQLKKEQKKLDDKRFKLIVKMDYYLEKGSQRKSGEMTELQQEKYATLSDQVHELTELIDNLQLMINVSERYIGKDL